MNQQKSEIECPNCGASIDVNDILYHQVSDKLKRKYTAKLAEQKQGFEEELNQLAIKESELAEEKEKYEEKLETAIKSGIATEKEKLKKTIKSKIQEEEADRINVLQTELNEKSIQLKEFNKAKSEIERLKREKDELKDQVEADAQKTINDTLKKEREKIKKLEEQRVEIKLIEKDQLIDVLKEQIKEVQRKAEQGSMQTQGEAQEIAIEDWLNNQFPYDTIDEIKKGVRGGDCIQTVNTPTRQNCGTIYYESKRTKAFQASWIEKFKNDIRDKNANIGILVTEAMPDNMDRAGQKDGIWVCDFEEFKILSVLLRDSLIRVNEAISSEENKGDKMNMLYGYLTSNEFRLQIEAIVEGFTQMQMDLVSEKRALQGQWKKREKQIQKVLENTNFMYSSIKGIAGNAIQSIKLLELPDPE